MVNCPYVLYQHVKWFRPSYWCVLLEVSKMVMGIWNNQFRRLPEGNNLSRHRDKKWPLQQCWIQIKRRLEDLMVAHQKELFVLDFAVFFLPDVSWLHLISKLLFEFVVIYLTLNSLSSENPFLGAHDPLGALWYLVVVEVSWQGCQTPLRALPHGPGQRYFWGWCKQQLGSRGLVVCWSSQKCNPSETCCPGSHKEGKTNKAAASLEHTLAPSTSAGHLAPCIW